MKNIFRISGVILVVLLIFLIHSCKKSKPTPPIITTTAASAITQTTATSGGNITSDGGANVTARGVCWSTTTGPTTALSTKTTDDTGTGIFTSSVTALTAGTVYYVKAYATNSEGTAYGNEIIFTSTASTVPVLTTTVASAITQSTATSGGNVTSDGGATVTARGVCWSKTTGPTTTLSTKTTDGTGAGSFTSAMTGLTANTTYYVRAYATNNIGTSYGNELILTTTIGPQVEWINPNSGDIVTVYHSANGVPSGVSFYQKFNVLNESGDITIVIQDLILNLTKTSIFNVEAGKQYELIATINYVSQSGIQTSTKCQTFNFSSLNCTTTKEFYTYEVRVHVGGPYPVDYTVCPGSLTIGDVGISLVN